MKAVIVYNPKSGSSLPKRELKRKFTDAKIEVVGFVDITNDLTAHLKKYIDQSEIVVAGYGRDGTLSSIAALLRGTKTVFAPLPGGTLNHFTKDLGINQDLDTAIRALPGAKARKVDIATVNGRVFLNNSSIGLYPSSLMERSKLESSFGKWPSAVYASIKAFARFRLYEVMIDGTSFRTPFIFVGNNYYDADNLLARSSIDSGKLCIYAIDSSQRRSLLKILLYTIIGRATETSELKMYRSTAITIKVKKSRVRVSYDGEHTRLVPPLSYAIEPGSLRLIS